MHYKIRPATVLDVLLMHELGQRYSDEALHHEHFPVEHEHCSRAAVDTIISDDGDILLAFNGNELIGYMWCYIGSLPWSTKPLAFDALLYVEPQHRHGVGVRLIKAYVEWAEQKGAIAANISIASGINNDRTVKLYEKLGFEFVGQQHRKAI